MLPSEREKRCWEIVPIWHYDSGLFERNLLDKSYEENETIELEVNFSLESKPTNHTQYQTRFNMEDTNFDEDFRPPARVENVSLYYSQLDRKIHPFLWLFWVDDGGGDRETREMRDRTTPPPRRRRDVDCISLALDWMASTFLLWCDWSNNIFSKFESGPMSSRRVEWNNLHRIVLRTNTLI